MENFTGKKLLSRGFVFDEGNGENIAFNAVFVFAHRCTGNEIQGNAYADSGNENGEIGINGCCKKAQQCRYDKNEHCGDERDERYVLFDDTVKHGITTFQKNQKAFGQPQTP